MTQPAANPSTRQRVIAAMERLVSVRADCKKQIAELTKKIEQAEHEFVTELQRALIHMQ